MNKINILYGEEAISYEDIGEIKFCEYRIAIPSYKRASTLRDKTLSMLKSHNISPDRIDVFCANEEEQDLYMKTLEEGTYSRIIVGVVGMMNIRNFIQNYYAEGTNIVCIDDDIKDVVKIAKNGTKKYSEIENLEYFFQYAFAVTAELGAKYWGVYAAANPFFMKRSICCGLYYLIGSFWGMVVSHSKDLYVTMDDKEDFERSVRAYLKYGKVARMNFVTVKSSYYTEKGGMQEERTEARVEWSAKKLMAMFPNQVQINKARKKHFEVMLVEKRKNVTSRKVYNFM